MTDQQGCQVTTAAPTRESADALARSVVEARLAACAQVSGPIASTYHWKGRIETAEEWLVAFKTTILRYPELEAHITERHPYEVPEILAVPVAGSAAYLAWLREETTPRAG